MSDLGYSQIKLNDLEIAGDAPVTAALFTKLGGAVNYLLDKKLRVLEFTTPGTTSWQAPADVESIYLLGIGGGGGGGAGGGNNSISRGGGGGAGGGAGFRDLLFYPVTPGNFYSVTIGASGVGGLHVTNSSGLPGTDGTETSFNTVVRFSGGFGGGGGSVASPGIGVTAPGGVALPLSGYSFSDVLTIQISGGNGGRGSNGVSANNLPGTDGRSNPYSPGGLGGVGVSSAQGSGGGGGGAAGLFGLGGAGGARVSTATGNPGLAPASGIYGAGGGGGGGGGGASGSARQGGDGAAGTNGYLAIIYISTP